MAADFYASIDVSTLATTYGAAPTATFGAHPSHPRPCETQFMINDGQGTATAVFVSFDGVTDHGKLGVTPLRTDARWDKHTRDRVWLRRAGAAGVAQTVQVYAWSEL